MQGSRLSSRRRQNRLTASDDSSGGPNKTMAENLHKRPSKGILKNSSSFDTQESHSQAKKNKETKWDEMNIIATLHPPDKDYGHMKIDEPKTPYNYTDPDGIDALDAKDLAEKIQMGVSKPPKVLAGSSEDSGDEESDEDLTPEQRALKKEFENKRKKHYNEFYAVKLARKLLEEDEDDEDEEEGDLPTSDGSKQPPKQGCSKNCPDK